MQREPIHIAHRIPAPPAQTYDATRMYLKHLSIYITHPPHASRIRG
ncbi:predicted protein [Plenodomus lingam JN3]|uniref:Predicted protein n=1 Tax=Leptosphaeria maculans (strain JN3 / isolate v23.1.3 / race Av1-4-5-6-7-8) TaxID=985895 RepID=E5ACT7_LEPMJ|nr:predicted protein [Plenodomus lingam JN3]CBY02289.1 predicted protein [Plenodomus lingam JN3]